MSIYPSERRVKDCMGLLVCPHCGDAVLCCNIRPHHVITPDDVTEKTIGEQMDLGSAYDKDAKGGGKKFKQKPFLKAKDIPVKGCTAKIMDFREAPKQAEYSDFFCDVQIGKKEFTWGLKSKTVTLNMLIDELGKRTEKWIGKSIKLVRGGPKGQYVNLG